MEQENLNLNEIWRVCRKIQSAIYRHGYRISDYYKFFDPNGIGLISESKFSSILGQLKNIIGLSEFEIKEVTNYFRLSDGRVAYKQFCDVISEDQDHTKNHDLVSGLEWNDPLHVNSLSLFEKRLICILLTSIAQTVRLRDIVLLPYFQDYELISKNAGTVTIPHFSRVLHFMKIILSENDFILLLKRYLKDSYTVNYVAFIKDIEEIIRYLDSQRLVDFSEDIIENFPGRLIDVKLPKLPRPEIGNVRISDVFGKETSYHSTFNKKKPTRQIEEIFLRIQRHIFENSIRINEFFGSFDILNCGYITKNQFLRALDNVGVSSLHRLFLTNDELKLICQMYEDPNDMNRCNWKQFEHDVNKVFNVSNLEKKPYQIITCPPTKVTELKRSGQENWQNQKNEIRNLCEDALYKIKTKITNRRLYLRQFFKDFDKCNLGHVTRSQIRQVLTSNGILLSDEEFYALEKRYIDEIGFNYVWLLSEADPKEFTLPKFEECPPLEANNLNKIPPPKKELDIVHVLAKVKKQVVIKRIRIIDFLKDYDKLNHESINKYDFQRGLDNANIKLTIDEIDVICEFFKTPFQKACIDYKRFCKVIEEVFYQDNLERAPLNIPIQYFPSTDCDNCFLNFEERTIISKALQKLSKSPDHISNLSQIFEDYDRQNCGTVSINQFLRALTVRNLINLISSREFDTICKCFGVEKGCHMEVDYRSFMKIINIIFHTEQRHPF